MVNTQTHSGTKFSREDPELWVSYKGELAK